MLKDITLGQYFPGNSFVHRLDPRTKLLMLIVYIVALFLATGWVSYHCDFHHPFEVYYHRHEASDVYSVIYRCTESVFHCR